MPPFGSPPQRRALRPSRRDGGHGSSLRLLEIAINVAMLGAVDGRSRLSESLQAYRDVFGNPQLRRIELALVGSVTGDWAYAIALSVFAYEPGRRPRRRPRRAAALLALGRRGALPRDPGRPLPPRAGDGDVRPPAGARDRSRCRRGAPRRAAAARDRARRQRPLIATAFRPAQAALLPSLARARRSSRLRTSRRARSRASAASPARRSAASCSRSRAPASSSPPPRSPSSGRR